MKYHSAPGAIEVDHALEFTYTGSQRSQVRTAIDLIDSAFQAEAIKVNFRKGFVRIMMVEPVPKNTGLAAKVQVQFAKLGYSLERDSDRITVKLPRTVLA